MRNPWIAIMVAADSGRGPHLTAAEISWLVQDSAIAVCASNDIDRAGGDPPNLSGGDWSKVDPHKYPINPSIVVG